MPNLKDLPKDYGKTYEKLKRLIQRLPKDVGNLAVNHFQDSWEKQGFTDQYNAFNPWQKRKENQWGKKKSNQSSSNRGILIGKGSGRLRRSIRIVNISPNKVTVGTDVPYAKIHNEGGEVNTTQKVKSYTRKEHVRTWKGSSYKVRQHKVSAFSRRLKFTMPQRQFMGESYPLTEALRKLVEKEINKAFGQ